MKETTRLKYNALLSQTAASYGVSDVTTKFSVTPERAQTVIERQKESSAFLGRINTITVTNMSGDASGLDVTGLIARRTNTSTTDRTPRSVHGMVSNMYDCKKIEFDTAVKYEALDAWAQQPGFGDKIRTQTDKQIALNKIMVGFNGMGAAEVTDPVKNPKGEDVASGWLHKIKTRVPAQYLTEGGTANEIRIGTGGDYTNLDEAVNDMLLLLDPAHAEATDLVAIIGNQLISHAKSRFYAENGNKPTEKARIEDQQVIGTFGGLPAYKVPHFPARGILITTFSNLSIYVQGDSIRRQYLDNPKRDQIETYQSENLDYVIEDLGKVALMESANVKFLQDNNTWA
jgi:P2 family phage major capsid protein